VDGAEGRPQNRRVGLARRTWTAGLPAVLLAVPVMGGRALAEGGPAPAGSRAPARAEATVRLDLTPEARRAIGSARGSLDARTLLAEGLRIELRGHGALQVRVTALLIGWGAAAGESDPDRPYAAPGWPPAWSSGPFALRPGSNRLPGPDFVPLPDGRTGGYASPSFGPGDGFLLADRPIRADRFPEDARSIRTTGLVFGNTRVDLARQAVIYLVPVPADGKEAASIFVLPVAFILNGSR